MNLQPALLKSTRSRYAADNAVTAYSFECGVALVGAGIFMASILFPPLGGAALAVYAVGAILGPTVVAIGVAGSCG